jgi:hypothetical protein
VAEDLRSAAGIGAAALLAGTDAAVLARGVELGRLRNSLGELPATLIAPDDVAGAVAVEIAASAVDDDDAVEDGRVLEVA